MKEIHIAWRGPFSLSEAKEESKFNSGIYQYYGTHPVYGPDALLYLGKASDGTIDSRLNDHIHELWSSDPVKLYIGNIISEEKLSDQEWVSQIEKAEKILIYTHTPAWNSSNIKSVKYDELMDIHILNWGYRGKLLPEVSSVRWSGFGKRKPENLKFQDEF